MQVKRPVSLERSLPNACNARERPQLWRKDDQFQEQGLIVMRQVVKTALGYHFASFVFAAYLYKIMTFILIASAPQQ
jgi:hypothetical protein